MQPDDSDVDGVDEASAESFPASDPPAFTGTHAGAPAHERETEDEPPSKPTAWLRWLALAGALVGLAVFAGLSARRRH